MPIKNGKRSYEDYCCAAHALDLIGDRWAMLIVRDLLLGPKRFSDLRNGLASISPNVLTQRLSDMEETGVVLRRKLPRPASAWVYELTEWGYELETTILQLARWGARSPSFERGKAIGPDALLLSFKAMFVPPSSDFNPVCIGLIMQGDHYHASIVEGRLYVGRGPATSPAAVLEGDTPTLLAMAYGNLDPELAAKANNLRYSGDLPALRRFFSVFSLPAPIAPVSHTFA